MKEKMRRRFKDNNKVVYEGVYVPTVVAGMQPVTDDVSGLRSVVPSRVPHNRIILRTAEVRLGLGCFQRYGDIA